MKKLQVSLVPFRRLHFFCPAFVPQLSQSWKGFNPPDLKWLAEELFLQRSLLVDCDPTRGKCLTALAQFRGPISKLGIDREVGRISASFADFIPNCINSSVFDIPPARGARPSSAALLSNSTSVRELLGRAVASFSALYARREFLRRYEEEGMDTGEMVEAGRNVNDLISDYVEHQGVPCVKPEKTAQQMEDLD